MSILVLGVDEEGHPCGGILSVNSIRGNPIANKIFGPVVDELKNSDGCEWILSCNTTEYHQLIDLFTLYPHKGEILAEVSLYVE